MNRDKLENERRIFHVAWWLVNLLLFVALLCTIGTGAQEYSVRKYLSGCSDAVVPEAASSREKVEAILAWMSNGPPRLEANHAKSLPIVICGYLVFACVTNLAAQLLRSLARRR